MAGKIDNFVPHAGSSGRLYSCKRIFNHHTLKPKIILFQLLELGGVPGLNLKDTLLWNLNKRKTKWH